MAIADRPAPGSSSCRHSPAAAVRVRAARPEDLPAVLRLFRAVFREASIDHRIQALLGGPSWARIKCATVREQAAANPGGCFVAVADNAVVGYIGTTVNAIASRGCILDLAVARDCQGRGIGRRLLRHALRHFRRLGLRQAKIETLETNQAGQHLYPALGFVEVARQIHYAMPLQPRRRGADDRGSARPPAGGHDKRRAPAAARGRRGRE
jgi:ribosomal protein S18 acetylase RimI-like enzyme